MEKAIIKFGDNEIKKQKFHQRKRRILMKIQRLIKQQYLIRSLSAKKNLNILLATKIQEKNKLLCICLPKMSAYRKDFDETKYVSFLIKEEKLLEKYNEIWEKIKISIKKEFDSEPVYNEKYLKAKMKSCNRKINTNFRNNEIPKEDSQYICLSVILIDSVFRTGENYYPQVFLEECKYAVKEKKISKYIIDDTEIS